MWFSSPVGKLTIRKRHAYFSRNCQQEKAPGVGSYIVACFMDQRAEVVERLSTSGQRVDEAVREKEIRETFIKYCTLLGDSGNSEPLNDDMMAELNEMCSNK
jgi:hypothetical protein